jgi:hypothetical protein
VLATVSETVWVSMAAFSSRRPGVLGSRVMGSFFGVCLMLYVVAYKPTSAAPKAAESPFSGQCSKSTSGLQGVRCLEFYRR